MAFKLAHTHLKDLIKKTREKREKNGEQKEIK